MVHKNKRTVLLIHFQSKFDLHQIAENELVDWPSNLYLHFVPCYKMLSVFWLYLSLKARNIVLQQNIQIHF